MVLHALPLDEDGKCASAKHAADVLGGEEAREHHGANCFHLLGAVTALLDSRLDRHVGDLIQLVCRHD